MAPSHDTPRPSATASPGAAPAFAVVIPVYNHGGTVRGVIEDVLRELPDLPLILVNDGSTDGTAAALAPFAADPRVHVITLAKNSGKGAALWQGFKAAREMGRTHALTLDADRQHHVPDAPRLLAAAAGHPDDLIIGQRDMDGPGVPARSRKGRDFARFWLRVETGQDVPDSQCGFRVYPLAHALALPCRFPRFDFETEILARAAWAGLTVRSVPVTCIYFPPETRVSHFRPWADSARGVRVNVFLVLRRLVPVPFRQLVARRADDALALKAWWRPSTWRRAAGAAMRTGASNAGLAAAFALGIFVGLTPFYGLQTILAVYFARRLHLNMLAAVIGSQVSIPPLVPLWAYLSAGVGHVLLHGRWLDVDWSGLTWDVIRQRLFWPALLGNPIVALVLALLGLVLARAVLYWLRPAHNAAR